MVNLFYNRNNFTLISKALCTSQAFVCLSSHLSLALHLGVNICGRFNAASIKYLLHVLDMQQHKITDFSAEPFCRCAEKSLSNGIMRSQLA